MNHQPTVLSQDVTVIEQKMAALERENFDLKMRLFYKEKESLKDTTTLENEAERVVGILQARDDTYDQLRRANEEAYNTIADLRAELQVVKASKEGSNSAYENLLQKNQRLASLQLEENLKRERQAAQAIASHDASLIAKLEEDIEALQATHEADSKLVSECAGRVAELMNVVEEKNAIIEKQENALNAANEHIEVLKDRISRQEVALIRGERNSSMPKDDPKIANIIEPVGMIAPPRPNLSSNSLHSSDLTASMNPSTSRRNLNSSRIPAVGARIERPQSPYRSNDDYYDDDEVVGSSESLRPAPRLGQPFMATQEDNYRYSPSIKNAPASNSRHFTLSDLSSPVTTSVGGPSSSPYHYDSTLRFNLSSPQPRNTPLRFEPTHNSHSLNNVTEKGCQRSGREDDSIPSICLSEESKKLINVEIELDVLKEENEVLKQTLEQERKSFKKLEETLAQVRSSSEEITLLEAEEIARLEVEMERIAEERDKFMENNRSLEVKNELLQQNLRDMSGGNNWSRSNGRISSSNTKEPLHHTDSTPVANNRTKDSALFDMYRRREVELLDALEGVVRKCHSMEEELKAFKQS